MGGIIYQQQILPHRDEDLTYDIFLDHRRQELVNLLEEHQSTHGYILLFLPFFLFFM